MEFASRVCFLMAYQQGVTGGIIWQHTSDYSLRGEMEKWLKGGDRQQASI